MPRTTRRGFIRSSAVAAAASPALANTARTGSESAAIYERLGVRPVINGVGTVTVLGGSIMPEEVVQAMVEASRHFIDMPELQRKAGARIAQLIGVPAAMVTAGAASGIAVAATACIALGDPARLRQLPDTTGMKHEVILQKTHRSGYEAQMTTVGARLVWVETRQELEQAINDRTAMLFFLNKADPDGQIKRQDWIRIGKERGVPTFNDAAADVPPSSRLRQYVDEGFDLVTFSGGKGLLGPQASGILMGRPDLIEAGRLSISPHGGVGRAMKVGKEEILGLVAAVERYLKTDHAAERKELDRRADAILRALRGVSGVQAEKHLPEIANNVPHVLVHWSSGSGRPESKEVIRQLREGEPPIAVSLDGGHGLRISVWMLRGSEHEIVARRLREVLAG